MKNASNKIPAIGSNQWKKEVLAAINLGKTKFTIPPVYPELPTPRKGTLKQNAITRSDIDGLKEAQIFLQIHLNA